jgi:hypothetical protein
VSAGFDTYTIAGSRACSTSTRRLTHPIITNQSSPHYAEALATRTVDIAEIVVEVHGQLYSGPPKTRAGRRTVGLPQALGEELAAHMGPVGPADAYVFTAEKGSSVCHL